MDLLHNSYTTSLSFEEAVSAALKNPVVEIDMAASKHFWDFEGDWDAVIRSYAVYFDSMVTALTQILGQPIYRGKWDDPNRQEWNPLLPEYATALDLAVWQKDDLLLYVRNSREDKECPILIALGAEGSQATGSAYPGQFE